MSQTRASRRRKAGLPELPPGPSPRLLALAARGWTRFLAAAVIHHGSREEAR
ncbi:MULTISPECIES: hypothetical protein [Streptomyces]|uniref:hypothetical protein n=1 Tax=Streptomyces TaxID=1883 RepID=UPI00131D20CA|nr:MULTISPECIES: hypothetical protein [Streptomyces]MCX4716093.1 hypothetical protein [Streptomyces virginiae]MYV74833.1 hypothetical protein [Streptomyces sp. SID1046]